VIASLAAGESIALPRQILREYLSVVTGRGFNAVPISMEEGMRAVDRFQRTMRILEVGPAVWAEFDRLARSVRFAGKQVHDANIVATMLAYGQTRLLTFNAKDFRRFEPLIEVIEP
jgi:predicted nucleic acid-binding protein